METTIYYFKKNELDAFFYVLANKRLTASTEFTYKNAVRNEALFYTMYYCALRVSEVTILDIEDFNILKKEIHCKRINGGINNTLKIMDGNVLTALNRHIRTNQPNGLMFMNLRDNKPLSRKTIDHIVKEVCIEANIMDKAKWHSHTFRHTKAMELTEEGVDMKEIQYWLGHKSISNTQVYFDFAALQHLAMYQKLRQRRRPANDSSKKTE